MQIVYIDDDPDEVLIFCEAVNDIDASIECCGIADSTCGMVKLQSDGAPDFIFLDYNMPGLSGQDCLVQIRSLGHLSNVPVIIYSTGVSASDADRLISLGASMVVKKHSSMVEFKSFFQQTFLPGTLL